MCINYYLRLLFYNVCKRLKVFTNMDVLLCIHSIFKLTIFSVCNQINLVYSNVIFNT